MGEPFEEMLTGGPPNSLGRDVEVVDAVLVRPARIDQRFACHASGDPSSGFAPPMRLSGWRRRRTTSVPQIDRLILEVGVFGPPSAQSTLALLFARLAEDMDARQRPAARDLIMRILAAAADWIVTVQIAGTLTVWAADDAELRTWLTPHLRRLSGDPRKSAAARAARCLKTLGARSP